MRKKEIRALLVLIALAATAGLGWLLWWGASIFELDQQKDSYSSFQNENTTTYQQGDTISCNSYDDDNLKNEEGWQFHAGFDWNGTMNWKVIDSWLYDTPTDAGITDASPGSFSPMPKETFESDDFVFLMCTVQLENIDAQYEDESDDHFNIATFRTGWIGYFDGTYEGAGQKDAWKYSLAPGETAVYRIGYYIKNPDTNPEFLIASIGNASNEVKKISVQLQPQDLRGGKQ